MVLLQEKTILFQGSRRGPTFPGGVPTFFQGGGVQMLISIETHIVIFQGGMDPLSPPLDPHLPYV